jgi:hypothetical protein
MARAKFQVRFTCPDAGEPEDIYLRRDLRAETLPEAQKESLAVAKGMGITPLAIHPNMITLWEDGVKKSSFNMVEGENATWT